MSAEDKTIMRMAARALETLKRIIVPKAWTKEVAGAKVIEFHSEQHSESAEVGPGVAARKDPGVLPSNKEISIA